MHSNIADRLLKAPQRTSRGQRGFATAAKAIAVTLSVTGVGLLATSNFEPRPDAISKSVVSVVSSTDALRGDTDTDPEAELREWLREPHPSTF